MSVRCLFFLLSTKQSDIMTTMPLCRLGLGLQNLFVLFYEPAVISGTEPKWSVTDWKNAEGDEVDTWQKFVNEQPENVLDARLQLRND